ncbi:DUF1015 family protein [Streptomyces sulphureus]|uniref:DUF1015 family protein n=1 Tax=Streptomyces sulphureus TaxID=47758 RepID=UPI000361DEFD|nr:DUF1015 domain-containing protein [Streptomyces sulphureus]
MAAEGLRLTPFRGLRYAPDRVGSLAAVTSPPYDVVVRPDGLHHLETANPYNIVRLILPHGPNGSPAAHHTQAARTLNEWRESGVLRRDARPALYVYEQRTRSVLQRGLVGALQLPRSEGVVLPHEEVIDEVVADRAALMEAIAANPEPLLLSYRGAAETTGAAAVIERAVHGTPLLATTTEDGTEHRLWAVTDPAELAEAAGDLAHRTALIADGHHRWATYLRLRDAHAPAGAGERSPWESGLVLLVDTDRYPLQVQAIHRVLPRLPLQRALDLAAPHFRVRALHVPLPQAAHALRETPGNAYLLTEDGETFHLLDAPEPGLLARTVRTDRPEAWRSLDATVLHSTLLDSVWHVQDVSGTIEYLHNTSAAIAKAASWGGTAVLMRPVAESTVRELAEQGVTMPRKSTSFGPKPATGLVLRTLDGTGAGEPSSS